MRQSAPDGAILSGNQRYRLRGHAHFTGYNSLHMRIGMSHTSKPLRAIGLVGSVTLGALVFRSVDFDDGLQA